MSDAAEVLLCVYERAMEVAARQGRPACVDATFGLAVAESVHCHRCGKVTQQSDYVQYCYNTQVGGVGGGWWVCLQWGTCDWWQAYKPVGSRLWVCAHLVPAGLPTLSLVPCTHFRRPPRCVRCAVWRPRWASCCAWQRCSTRRAATRCAWGWAEGTNRPRVSVIGEGLYGWFQEGRRAPSCIDA